MNLKIIARLISNINNIKTNTSKIVIDSILSCIDIEVTKLLKVNLDSYSTSI